MKLKSHDTSVTKSVIATLMRVAPAGSPITDSDWNMAYKCTRADAMINTILWKQENIRIHV